MSRLNGREIERIYPILVRRDGEICQFCQKSIDELGVDKLEIHEIKYERPLRPINMKLLCHGCNNRKEFTKSNITGTREMTPEHQVNRKNKKQFRIWMWHLLQENNHHYSYEDLVGSAAYLFDVETVTIERWIKPLISSYGPYKKEPFGLTGEEHIIVKGKNFSMEEQYASGPSTTEN